MTKNSNINTKYRQRRFNRNTNERSVKNSQKKWCWNSAFCRGVNEIFAFLGCYATILVTIYWCFETTYLSHFKGEVVLDSVTPKKGR